MTTKFHDKRIVSSVIKETASLKPGKGRATNSTHIPMLLTEDGWLCAFSLDRSLGVAVKTCSEEKGVELDANYDELAPGVYPVSELERWAHPMGGVTPKPLDEVAAEQNRRWYGALVLPLLRENFIPVRHPLPEPPGQMLPLRCLAAIHRIKCLPKAGRKAPTAPIGAHGAWAKSPEGRSPMLIVWAHGVLRAIACPVKEL